MILVTGAGGFIGRTLVPHLVGAGLSVRAFVRQPAPFLEGSGADLFLGDIGDATRLTAALDGVSSVVHLAALTRDQPESRAVNVEGARCLIEACRQAGCRRIVNVSTLSTKLPRRGLYGETKRQADALFASSGLDVTTLLLSLVYGNSDEGLFGTLSNAVRSFPLVPVLGDGKWLVAPVARHDIINAIVACLDTPATIGRCYDLGGPELMTFDMLLDAIGRSVGTPKVRKLHLPFSLSLATSQILAAVMRQPPLTVSNVLGSNQNVPIEIESARRDFGFQPVRLEEGLLRTRAREGNV